MPKSSTVRREGRPPGARTICTVPCSYSARLIAFAEPTGLADGFGAANGTTAEVNDWKADLRSRPCRAGAAVAPAARTGEGEDELQKLVLVHDRSTGPAGKWRNRNARHSMKRPS
ncbi:MAG: hypothetical protein OXD44_11000 [Gammaproteobacteria bacterium]|nr:hypothetical protein [Gammaproteobacteria bacterium]